MPEEKVLTVQERIALRRQAAAAHGAGTHPPAEQATPEPPKEPEEAPAAQLPPRTRRVAPAPAAPEPPAEDAIPPAPTEPARVPRRIIKADGTEVTPAPAAQPPAPEPPKEPEKKAEPPKAQPPTPPPAEPVVAVRRPIINQEPPVADDRMTRVQEQAKAASQALIIGMLEHMRAGEQLLITRDNAGLWSIVIPTSVVGHYVVQATPSGAPKVERKVAAGKLPRGFEQSMWTEAYKKFVEKWENMTLEQRLEMAKSLGLTIPGASNPEKANKMILNMHLSMGVQEAQGIDKYLPQYSSTETRKKAEENARAGLPW